MSFSRQILFSSCSVPHRAPVGLGAFDGFEPFSQTADLCNHLIPSNGTRWRGNCASWIQWSSISPASHSFSKPSHIRAIWASCSGRAVVRSFWFNYWALIIGCTG